MRSALGVVKSQDLKIARFEDKMREVAMTEGDKVEAQIKFGWSTNYYPLGDLVKYIEGVKDREIDRLMNLYKETYTIATDKIDSIRYQAKIELGIKSFLEEGGFDGFTTTFEDLHGLKQLP